MSDADPIPVSGPTASPKAVRERQKRVRYTERQRVDHWRAVLDTPSGRAVLWELLEFAGIYRGGFSGERAHFNEGQRNVGLKIVAAMEQAYPNALDRVRAHHLKDAETHGHA